MRMCQSVLGNPNCKEARATVELSLFIVIIVVWTRVDGSSPNNRNTSASCAIKASNAKTHEADGDTASPSAARSSTQGMGIQALLTGFFCLLVCYRPLAALLCRPFEVLSAESARGAHQDPCEEQLSALASAGARSATSSRP